MDAALQKAIGYEQIDGSNVQTFMHTELLNGDANDVWEACKHAVALLPDLAPDYFAKAEFAQGSGAPGSIGVFHFGPGTNSTSFGKFSDLQHHTFILADVLL